MGNQQLVALGILSLPKYEKNEKMLPLWGWKREQIHRTISQFRNLPLGPIPQKELMKLLSPLSAHVIQDIADAFLVPEKSKGGGHSTTAATVAHDKSSSRSSNSGPDPLDLFSVLILLSDMHRTTKITYLFSLHNRQNDGALSHPEFMILMRSTLRALAKVFVGYRAPGVGQLEQLASQIFERVDSEGNSDKQMDLPELLCACYQSEELSRVLKEWDGLSKTIIDSPLTFDESFAPPRASIAQPAQWLQRPKIVGIQRKEIWRAYDMFRAMDTSGNKQIGREDFLVRIGDAEFLKEYSAVLRKGDLMTRLRTYPSSLSLTEYLCIIYPRMKPDNMKVLHRWCNERDALDVLKGRIGFGTKDEDWEAMFGALDCDGSGKISIEELRIANLVPPAELYKYIAVHDVDKDGELSYSEFKEVAELSHGGHGVFGGLMKRDDNQNPGADHSRNGYNAEARAAKERPGVPVKRPPKLANKTHSGYKSAKAPGAPKPQDYEADPSLPAVGQPARKEIPGGAMTSRSATQQPSKLPPIASGRPTPADDQDLSPSEVAWQQDCQNYAASQPITSGPNLDSSSSWNQAAFAETWPQPLMPVLKTYRRRRGPDFSARLNEIDANIASLRAQQNATKKQVMRARAKAPSLEFEEVPSEWYMEGSSFKSAKVFGLGSSILPSQRCTHAGTYLL